MNYIYIYIYIKCQVMGSFEPLGLKVTPPLQTKYLNFNNPNPNPCAQILPFNHIIKAFDHVEVINYD